MFLDIYTKYAIRQTWRKDIANIRQKLSQCEVVPLSKGQKKDITTYYSNLLGKKVPVYWHEYFFSRNGNFSVKYVPTCFYHSDIIYKLNNYDLRHAYVDKGVYDIFFSDVLRPKTFVKNINGYFYDDSRPISREEAVSRCLNLDGAVSKPTQEGKWGKGVKVFSTKDGLLDDNSSIGSLMDGYKKNFIIQEKIQQHESMCLLNPTSLNTLRVLSYRQDNEVYILYVVVRIGRKGKSVDNETAGGINADIDLESGRIIDCAYGTPSEKRITVTDVGTILKGFQIPSFELVKNEVIELHLRLPYFNLIGWDFGIDEKGRPVMIEWNRAPDLSQTAHGPAFGEMTDEILRRVKILKDSRFEKL